MPRLPTQQRVTNQQGPSTVHTPDRQHAIQCMWLLTYANEQATLPCLTTSMKAIFGLGISLNQIWFWGLATINMVDVRRLQQKYGSPTVPCTVPAGAHTKAWDPSMS
jgi:hypothetical protein